MAKEIDIKNLDDIAAGSIYGTLTDEQITQALIELGQEQVCSLYIQTYPKGKGPITSKRLEEFIKENYYLEAKNGKIDGYNDSRDTDVIVKR